MATPARARSLSLAHQAFGLRSLFPDSKISLRGRILVWVGELRPSELSPPYKVRVTYEFGHYPEVSVIDPPITNTHDFVPHIYNSGSLCVHDVDDWHPGMLLVDTIIAWTIAWLYFWELFAATGKWFGDGPVDDTAGQSPVEDLPPLREQT